ncbi:hypothetical protein [Variovorax paradoxus]|uniref:hypothetical protein n=1 Tax=Variovorax paradoxus TaxID=34073 RepID=UPI0029C9627D|nr:hypothetical protein RZE77_10370 [Variovorax paradoxus]
MRRPIYFCDGWFAAKKFATEVWTEARAKEAHDNGRNYTVLVDSIERPFCIILVMAKGIAVDFLDERLRKALSYQFQVVAPGRMFLTMAVHREFDGDGDKVASGASYKFTEDGKVRIDRETFLPEHSLEVAHTEADVSSNYAAAPEFGHYEEFIRMERQAR